MCAEWDGRRPVCAESNLKKDDAVVGMDVVLKNQKGNQLLVLTENGFGKRSDLKSYKIQKRGGSGIKTAKITPKTGKLVCAHIVNLDNLEVDLIASSAKGQIIRVPLKSISVSRPCDAGCARDASQRRRQNRRDGSSIEFLSLSFIETPPFVKGGVFEKINICTLSLFIVKFQ